MYVSLNRISTTSDNGLSPIRHQANIWTKVLLLYPPNNEVVGGILVSPRPSVRPSVRLSRLPCPLCNIYSSRWILSILLATNDHYHERVCRTQWLWPISSRSFGLDLENRVRSVESTALDGFFLYLAQMITLIRGCVACYGFFSEFGNSNFWQILKNFQPWPWKKNLQFSMDSFHI